MWDEAEWVTLTEAREMLGYRSKDRLRRLIEREGYQTYRSPRDGRERLVKRADIERWLAPVPIERKASPADAND